MSPVHIRLGNKNYSSWSLRAWLVLRATGVPYEEEVIPLDRPETKARLAARSPSGRVPVIEHDGGIVWESLAIAEYLAERFPQAGLWPGDARARAHARAVSAEMHAGFAALRTHMPMDIRARHPGRGRGPGVQEDIDRIVSIWEDCRRRRGAAGGFLFGGFCIADAMYAPAVTRFVTYGVPLPPAAAAYRDAVLAWPAMVEWAAAAAAEPWEIPTPVV